VVDQGRIIARGTADELKAQVGGERIEIVVRDRAEIARAAQLLSGRTDGDGQVAIDEDARRLTVATNGGAKRLMQIGRDLDEGAIEIDDLGLHRPTLDDVFLSLTGHAAEQKTADDDEALRTEGAARRAA
jgi:ABC-2 type transport system ATP-binding protein